MAYLVVDGVAERLHAGLPREAVLCAWGITEDGRKVLLHLAPGTKEDTASCTAFFEDLKRRGLADPLLAVTDGAPGLIRAVETCFPRALRQRCLVHRMRNLRSKAPESQWPEIALRARGCYEAASPPPAAVLRDDFVAAYERELPTVVQCFRDDFDAGIAHLRFPLRHRRVIRTTNLLERLFLEERRRTKIIPHAFGGAEAHVCGRHPRGRPLARPHGGRVRAASVARDPRGTRSRPCRAHAARRAPHPERVPVEVIQQGSDLTQPARTERDPAPESSTNDHCAF